LLGIFPLLWTVFCATGAFYFDSHRLSAPPISSHQATAELGTKLRVSQPKRRFFELESAPTVIGAESIVMGDVRGAGQFVVAGQVHGDGDIAGGLNLAVTGVWNGYIRAEQAIIAGKITGGLEVKDKLEIGYTAVIRGKVRARTIAIAKGAIVDGEIEVTSEEPVIRFEERRGT
jgi:cytoskeletal protein CcmA (bactofilin family)